MSNLAQKEALEKAVMWICGQPFRPMVESDFNNDAGSQEGDLIAFPSDDVTLIYSPASKELHEIWDGDMRLWRLI